MIKCYFYLPLITHPLRSKPVIKTHLLCFSSRCKDLISSISEGKKNLINDWKNIIAYLEESKQSKVLANKCQQWLNLAALQFQLNIYPHLGLKQCFQHLHVSSATKLLVKQSISKVNQRSKVALKQPLMGNYSF